MNNQRTYGTKVTPQLFPKGQSPSFGDEMGIFVGKGGKDHTQRDEARCEGNRGRPNEDGILAYTVQAICNGRETAKIWIAKPSSDAKTRSRSYLQPG